MDRQTVWCWRACLVINAPLHSFQMVAKYYMGYTGMNQDEIEKNTCRDNFMTPEEAQLYGLIDHVVGGGKDDLYVPHSVVQKFRSVLNLINL